MKRKEKVRISQCMIVKDEEKNIEQALSWGKDFMYEQIVVDTGSSDRTVELAEAMGAKVFHFPWVDDFAAAKNYALKQASGSWIAFLDADEYIPDDMTDKVLPLLTELMDTSYMVLMCDLMNMGNEGKLFAGSTQFRFFRNSPDICYDGKIHESLRIKGKGIQSSEILNVSEEFIIIHTGYIREVMNEKGKGERNRRILFKELEEQPENRYLMGYIADTYHIDGDVDEAIKWFEKAVSITPETAVASEARDSLTFSTLLLQLGTKETEDRMLKIYEKAIKRLPQDADMDFAVGTYYAANDDYEKAVYYLERAVQILEEYGHDFRASRMCISVGSAWERLAACYYNQKKLNLCVNACIKLLKIQPYILKTLMLLLLAFWADDKRYQEKALTATDKGTVQPAATPVQVLTFLGKIYDLDSKKDRLFILKAAMGARYEGMIQLIKETFPAQEMEVLEQTMAKMWTDNTDEVYETTEKEE